MTDEEINLRAHITALEAFLVTLMGTWCAGMSLDRQEAVFEQIKEAMSSTDRHPGTALADREMLQKWGDLLEHHGFRALDRASEIADQWRHYNLYGKFPPKLPQS